MITEITLIEVVFSEVVFIIVMLTEGIFIAFVVIEVGFTQVMVDVVELIERTQYLGSR